MTRACHCDTATACDFPLVCDGVAVYSSKALWRSRLAVIIQLIGYEQSGPVTPLRAPRTEGIRIQEERLDISHTGVERFPEDGTKVECLCCGITHPL